jgi:hypothetical protein
MYKLRDNTIIHIVKQSATIIVFASHVPFDLKVPRYYLNYEIAFNIKAAEWHESIIPVCTLISGSSADLQFTFPAWVCNG